MPVLNSTADAITRKLPKVVSADMHLAADYLVTGALAAAGAWFWRRDRRTAVATWATGGALLGLTLLTSYPGRRRKAVDFPVHGKIEMGMAAMLATLPEFLRLTNSERKFFTLQAGILTAVSNLTHFGTDYIADRPRYSRRAG